jgi:opacity protein-like surface antigen
MRKLLLGATLALVALLSASAAAGATTVEIDPGGNIASDSNGRFSFTSDDLPISCEIELSGSLLTVSNGDLTATPRPERNARVGEITSGSDRNCTFGTDAELLFGGELPDWDIFGYAFAETDASMYVKEAQFKINAPFVDCLIRSRVDFTYDESTGVANVTGIAVLNAVGCPDNPGLTGQFNIDPTQTFVVI